MAIKKKEEAQKASVNIEQVRDLYLKFNRERTEAEKQEKVYKEKLVEWVKEHPELVKDNKADMGCGVTVEIRERLKGSWDENELDMLWLNRFVDEPGCAEAVIVKLDEKILKEGVPTERGQKLLEDIAYTIEIVPTYAVTKR